ncbi:MAG TPA: bifunctional phosphoribosylaminoimidazolecarboxamide formyltransferase/IMP cyclohydrolase [Alphaproteobacteria bacterium]|nr:bifunctional phosphoribosylaminoimidazolecarboxamide formyltransferase/IMP cyclohydrolase [Alphaproteobacteria bacterium]
MTDHVKITRALISVSDKSGLAEFGQFLAAQGVEVLSTGGTARALREAGVAVKDVSEATGFPEMLDGRVKTLHPVIHGGLLGLRDGGMHQAQMAEHGIQPIDLLVVNLYPFERTVAGGAIFDDCIENIDIGGPALIRGAAKNHAFVTVATEPEDLAAIRAEMEANNGATSLALRKKLAAAAYARTAAYDAAISHWFGQQIGEPMPRHLAFGGKRGEPLRYGENPHQAAAFYASGEQRPGVASARVVQGKELSYNNLNDTDAAFECVAEFEEPAVAIIKHANPCGVAIGNGLLDAWEKALRCDPVSAFGGIVAVNRALDGELADRLNRLFLEVVIAPEADEAALRVLATKKNVRVLLTGGLPDPAGARLTARTLSGGLLVQSGDNGRVTTDTLKIVTKRTPTNQELSDLLFAFRVAKHVKSNAIVYAKEGATVGVGAGQMSRVDSSRIAARKSADAAEAAGLPEPLAKGSVVASDAFFPFPDGLLSAAEAGATAVIQPGGSIRDEQVIAAADEAALAMVFTGMRHFRH